MPEASNRDKPPDVTDHALPDLPADEMDEVERIAADAKKARERHRSLDPTSHRRLDADAKSARGLGIGLTVAYTIIGLPLAGFLIGSLIDKNVGGTAWQTWLTLSLTVAGVVFASITLSRHSGKL